MINCGIKRIITFKDFVTYGPIKIVDELGNNVTSECLFSWSTDGGACWTSWMDYRKYNKIAPLLESDYNLRVLIFGGLSKVYYNKSLTDCYNICFDQTNVFLQEFCDNKNLLQPYTGLDCALLLQQQMADSVICMFGIPVYYIKTNPDKESVDYTFKEWNLHNVVDIKQLKLMIPDGQMPSSNPKLTDFDFDWEVDWETEMSKNQFAKAFGDTAYPKQRDLIYVPLMKRLWEVNSAYDEKNEGLMWRPTTWKLSLVKYNEKTNVDKGDFGDIIDGWLVNKYEDTFGSKERIEQERESGSPQLETPAFAATNLYNIYMEDSIRKQITKNDITIQDKIYCHNSNVTARNIYRFKNENGCVIYQEHICGPDGWISFILETPEMTQDVEEKEILRFGYISVKIKYENSKFYLTWGDMTAELNPFSTYMVIMRWNNRNKTADFHVYPYIHRENVPIYLLKPESYWWDFENKSGEAYEGVGQANDDWSIEGECIIHGWPVSISDIKYYRNAMDMEDILKESIKYTTNDERCIINDLARPVLDGHGYAVK